MLGHSDLSRSNEEREHLAAAHNGVVRVMSATGCAAPGSFRPAARCGCHGGEQFASHSFHAQGGSAVALVSLSAAGAVIVGAGTGSPSRRSAGDSTRRESPERFRLAAAHSSDRITTKWSRRARRSVRSWGRGARLIWRVIPTEKKNLGSFGVRVVVPRRHSSRRLAASNARASRGIGMHSRGFDLERGKRARRSIWLLRASGSCDHVGVGCAASSSLGQRRVVGA